MSKERSTIGDGWLTRYKVYRPLNDYEIRAKLDSVISVNLPPIDAGILRLNSTFIEYMDRHFLWRGWAAMGGVPIAAVFLWLTFYVGSRVGNPLTDGRMPSAGHIMVGWGLVSAVFVVVVVAVYFLLLKDFLKYTHYPVRFNRQNRKVYVFRHNGPDGVLELEWDQVYWFVGRSRDSYRFEYDLRCHVLGENGIIQKTFAVGNYSEHQAEVLQHWEMIRRYMEEPLGTLPFPPLALVNSAEPTLRNAVVIHIGTASGLPSMFMLLSIFWTFFRWISQKTCRRPRWPSSVEAVCQIAENDPYRQPEPLISGDVVGLDDERAAALFYYREQAELAAQVYQAEKYGTRN